MKNLIDFLTESRGQSISMRDSNPPYSFDRDPLVVNRETRDFRAENLKTKKYAEAGEKTINKYLSEVNKFFTKYGGIIKTDKLLVGSFISIGDENDELVKIYNRDQNSGKFTLGLYDMDYEKKVNVTVDPKEVSLKIEFSEEVLGMSWIIENDKPKLIGNAFLSDENEFDDYLDGIEFEWVVDKIKNMEITIGTGMVGSTDYSKYADSIARLYQNGARESESDIIIPLKNFDADKFVKVVNKVNSKW